MAGRELHDTTVIVTGASGGLGAYFVEVLHRAGARVVATARRADRLQIIADVCPGVLPVPADLTDESDVQRLVTVTRDQFGPIGALVNTAGWAGGGGIRAEEESIEDFSATLLINVLAPFRLSQLVLADMKGLGGGAIVNVGSISALVGMGRLPQASYAASKGAVHALTRELAAQWGRHGIRVNTLVPGMFRSEMTGAVYEHPRLLEWVRSNSLLPRPSEPSDFGAALLFLISEDSRQMTGQELVIDAGWTAR